MTKSKLDPVSKPVDENQNLPVARPGEVTWEEEWFPPTDPCSEEQEVNLTRLQLSGIAYAKAPSSMRSESIKEYRKTKEILDNFPLKQAVLCEDKEDLIGHFLLLYRVRLRILDRLEHARRTSNLRKVDKAEKRLGYVESMIKAVLLGAASSSPGWALKEKPGSQGGYSPALDRTLRSAYQAGKPKPTPVEVLEMWRREQPGEVIEAGKNSFTYRNADGEIKVVDKEALRKAIGRRVI